MNHMTFSNMQFKWTFRTYQQRVLDASNQYLHDHKIHIVAAPGSGKTILGLELIKRQNQYCLVFSPNITIREQWLQRFEEAYLPENQALDMYCSTSLHHIKPITSLTYQALHSIMNHTACIEEQIDYSKLDIFKLLKEYNIKTICLDEAHHLQKEWQKALENFIKALDNDITIIALTATPPYDASITEWNRYISVCGEIDEEIFVPELVAHNNLCPHQDFVYFNYPTKQESSIFKNYRNKVKECIKEMIPLPCILDIAQEMETYLINNPNELYKNFIQYRSIAHFLSFFHVVFPQKILQTKSEELSYKDTERALQYILDLEYITTNYQETIIQLLKKYGLYHNRKVYLSLSPALQKQLITSNGKLQSIKTIAKYEYQHLKEQLRMLILTDYIRKEHLSSINKEEEFTTISVISIFETLRKENITNKIGILSGSLVILPNDLPNHPAYTKESIVETNYSIYHFNGSNKDKVQIVTQMFQEGKLEILIGTKSLLGEGWDSPCINTLILASYVGSFVLSNQMRGRAIRIDKKKPNKVSNIWHLVTIEEDDFLTSIDLEMLSRRFENFIGPNDVTLKLENGIQRLTVIQPPFDQKRINEINEAMLKNAKNRQQTVTIWKKALEKSQLLSIELGIPTNRKVPINRSLNIFTDVLASMGTLALGIVHHALAITALVPIALTIKDAKDQFIHRNAKVSIQSLSNALLQALIETKQIDSLCEIEYQTFDNSHIEIIIHGSLRTQSIVQNALSEFFTPMDNPRYLYIKKELFKKQSSYLSFICPTILGQKKEYALVFQKHLKKVIGNTNLIYTRNANGIKALIQCYQEGYMYQAYQPIHYKKTV